MTTTAAITALLPTSATVSSSQANSISSDGAVAGYETLSDGTVQGFIASNGVVTLLSPTWSYAYAINSAHIAVGTAGSGYPATEWTGAAGTALISASTKGYADAINDNGVIGGYSVVNGTSHAYLISGGQVSYLTSVNPAVVSAQLWGLNNENAAVGTFTTGDPYGFHAFLWQNGTMTDLGTAYSGQTTATGINDQGLIVGYADSTAVSWKNDVMTSLGTLSGWQTSFANAVNNSGLIVGDGYDGHGNHHALLWENGLIIDLNSLLPANSGWVVEDAKSINDKDQIVGYGLYNGVQAAFEMTVNGLELTATPPSNSAQAIIQAFKAGTLTSATAVVDTAANVATYLDGLEPVAAAGKLASITLDDGGTPVLSLTAAQTVTDAAALAKLNGTFALQVNGDGSAVTVAGIAGHATAVSLSLPYEDVTLTAINGNTGFKLTGYSATAAPITDEFDQVAGVTFSDGTHAYVGAWGVSAIRSLGTLPAGALEPWSIDGSAEIVGFAGTNASPTLETGFYWYDGEITALSPLPGAQGSEALHDTGRLIVGESYAANNAGGSSTAVYWKIGDLIEGYTIPTSIGWLKGDFASIAISANYFGDIVGESYTTSTTYHGFLFKNGAMSDLGGLGGGQVEPLSINYSDLIVGKASISSGAFHAFSWQNGAMTDLGVLSGGTTSAAEAVNNSGTAVGYSTDGTGLDQAVYWSNGQIHRLPNLVGATTSIANAINEGGCIVGESANSSGEVAVLWANGALYNLNSFLPSSGTGWVLGDALSINDYDQVTGTGLYNGLTASFVLDLPANLILTATGALLEGIDNDLTGKVNISDTAAKVAAALDGLQALSAAGELGTITLTDGGVPNLTITSAQYTADSSVLDDISGVHTVTVQMGGNASQFDFSSGNVPHAAALQFADQTVILAATPGANAVTTGNLTELYAAVLGREPDIGGLAFYQTYLKSNPGTPLVQFAQWFLQSSEYTSSHVYAPDSTGDAKFITDSYQNLLHRAPDTGAIPFYQGVIDSYTKGLVQGSAAYNAAEALGHAWVLTYFSASAEFLTDVQITATHPADAQHWLLLT